MREQMPEMHNILNRMTTGFALAILVLLQAITFRLYLLNSPTNT